MRKFILIFVISSLFVLELNAQSVITDYPQFNGKVSTITDDGTYTYVGGNFTTYSENGYALNIGKFTTGSDDANLTFPTVNSHRTWVVASDGSSGWYVGGEFTEIAGESINYLAHINSDGSVDTDWNPNPNGSVTQIAVIGTDVYVGGNFTSIGGESRTYMAKLNNTDGDADASWDANPNSVMMSMATDGTYIYVGGLFTSIGGQSAITKLARVNTTNGNADAGWNPASNSYVDAFFIDGANIYVGGSFSTIGGQSRNRIAKLNNTDGSADASWDPNLNGRVRSIVVDGTDVYAGGDFTTVNNGTLRNYIAKFTGATGTFDATWNPNPDEDGAYLYDLAVSGSYIYIVGTYSSLDNDTDYHNIARVNKTNGAVDATWNPNPSDGVNDIEIDGTDIYVAGGRTFGGTEFNGVARINNSTSDIDATWNPNVNGSVNKILIDGSDIYLAGQFTSVNTSVNRRNLAKVNNTNGTADASFDHQFGTSNDEIYDLEVDGTDLYVVGDFTYYYTGTLVNGGAVSNTSSATINSNFPSFSDEDDDLKIMAIAPDGSGGWYVGGEFTSVGTFTRNNVVHIESDGSVDATWNPNVNEKVMDLIVDGNDIYIGGHFTSVNGGTTRNYAAKLNNTDGTADATWNPNFDDKVIDMELSSSTFYIVGQFSSVNGGTTRNYAAKLNNTDGTADATWNPNLSDYARTVIVDGNDIYIGGNFDEVNGGTTRNYLAKFNDTDGTADATWNPNASDYVFDMKVDGSNIYIGGDFDEINGGTTRNYAAKLNKTDGTVDATWNPNLNGRVFDIEISGSDIFLGGKFTTINGGTTRTYAAKVNNTDGSVNVSWNMLLSDNVRKIKVNGSDLFIGGEFEDVGNKSTRNNAAKIDLSGDQLDSDWDPNANSDIYTLLIDGSDIYVGGYFSSIGGQSRDLLAKLNMTNGNADGTWDPDGESGRWINAVETDGTNIYVGGSFATMNGGTTRNNLAKLNNTNGTLDGTWNPNANDAINDLIIDGNYIYVAGDFTTVGGQSRNKVAKLNNSDGLAESWNPNADDYVSVIKKGDGTNIFIGGNFLSVSDVNRQYLAYISLNAPAIYLAEEDVFYDGSATFNADIFDEMQSTTYNVAYGTTSGNYSNTTTVATLAGNSTTHTVFEEKNGLTTDTPYYYVVNAWNLSGTTTSSEGTFTIYSEPPSHAPYFITSDNTGNSLEFTFTDADSINAHGYILLYKQASSFTGTPTNFTSYSVGDAAGDAFVGGIVTNAADVEKIISNLTRQVTYTVKLFPFLWDGTNNNTMKFKTDPSIPSLTLSTIPTLGEWGTYAFIGLFALGGLIYIRKRI